MTSNPTHPALVARTRLPEGMRSMTGHAAFGLLLTALVLAACSGSGSGTPANGGTTGSGGATASGGTSRAGGATGSGGVTVATGTGGADGTAGAGGTTGPGGTGSGGSTAVGGTAGSATATGGARQDAGAGARDGGPGTGGATVTGGTRGTGGSSGTGGARQDAGADARPDSASGAGGLTATGGVTGVGGTTGTGGSTGAGGTPPTCTLPGPSSFKPNLSVGGGGSSYQESDHFIVFGAGSSADAALNNLEAANQCFVEEWCWRSPGLSITENSGTYYKLNMYAKALSGAAGVMQYDYSAGLAYLEVVPNSIANAGVTVHELGHALTLAEKGWVDQGRTGLWWESVANFVSDSFQTSPFCAKARTDHGIATGRTIIDLDANITNSFQIIVMNGNHYEAWPFLAYLTYNPDNYPGLGQMVLPTMFRTHKRNNETPLHVLERLTTPVTVQAIVGRYWARMAFVDIGHPSAQATFLSSRSRLDYKNLTATGTGTYTPITARQPKYCGANIIPLTVSGGTVGVKTTNLGNGQADSGFVATLAIRPTSGGTVRYVDLPNGAGEATVASDEEVTLTVANTPSVLYLYDPSSIGASDPVSAGLNYRLELTGATPTNL